MNPLPPSELQVRKPDVLAARPVGRVREPHAAPAHGGIAMTDVLYALYKHKKKVIVFTAIGLLVAATVYAMYPATYESQAKLLVRYVVERSTVDALDNATSSSGMSSNADGVIASEIEILTSWDLAIQVADAIGPKRMLPHSKAPPTKEAAAATIAQGLDVTSHKGGNILFVSYKNGDPELATLVLTELVNRYFNKHLEVHRSAGAFDFVTQQTDQVRARLNQTEDALKELKDKAGIISLESSTTALSNEEARTEEQLHAAEAELAEQQARVKQLGGVLVELSPAASPSATAADKAKAADEIPTQVAELYQSLVTRLPQLRQSKMEALAKYTAESQTVKSIQNEINDVETQRHSLEAKYPDLPSRVGGVSLSRGALDPASETARLAGLAAKKNALAGRLKDIRTRIQEVTQLSPQIGDLEREKQLEETNYKYFQGTLEKARVDEALDPSKIPNITAVQRPSPPVPMTRKRDKLVAGLAASGLAVGIAFALLKELVLNRNVRRPSEVERVAGTSALMSIPYCNGNGRPAKKRARRADETADVVDIVSMRPFNGGIAPWDPGHFIREYSEAIRDRLGLYFELHQLTHKPKLVGVAGLKQGAGTSTLAAGLAAALSETNDGKVLLVDVNLGPEHVHPFFRGKPAYPLNTALRPPAPIDAAAENLYLATVGSSNAGPAQLGLKKFFDLMPNLKASEFDYIIFDMPPLTSTSPTWGISPFMDKLLLVVEAERDNREALRRSYQKLKVERDNVSVVLNKTQSYGSRLLEVEG